MSETSLAPPWAPAWDSQEASGSETIATTRRTPKKTVSASPTPQYNWPASWPTGKPNEPGRTPQHGPGLMTRASQESQDGGNDVIAAEFLWGAFAHCLIVVAQSQGLPHDSHGAFTRIAQHMDAAHVGNRWPSCFGSGDQLHQHFYHGHLPEQELRSHTRQTTRGTLELLARL